MSPPKTTTHLPDAQLRLLLDIAEHSIRGQRSAEISHAVPGSFILRLGRGIEQPLRSPVVTDWNIHFVEVEWEIRGSDGDVLTRFDSGELIGSEIKARLTDVAVDSISLGRDAVEICFSNGLSIHARLIFSDEDDGFHPFMISYQGRWMVGLGDRGLWNLVM